MTRENEEWLHYLITIDKETLVEAGASLQDRKAGWVSNELSVVIIDDGLRDDVGSGGKVHEGRRRGCAVANTRGAPTTIGNGKLNGSRIVGAAISRGAVVLNVPVHRVAIRSVRSLALVVDVRVPVVGAGGSANAASGRRRGLG